jgi:Cu(I)/Ag(I) efflux system membrane fusion protein
VTRRGLVTLGLAAVLAVLGVVFRAPLIGWFTGGSTASGTRSAPVSTSAGPFAVEAAVSPDPPREKDNTLHLRIAADGQPVAGATVTVRYVMPAMGSMQEMRGGADVREDGDGRYRARFDLPMGGSWSLEIDVAAGGRQGSARYSFTVGRRGLAAPRGAGAPAPATPQPPALPKIELPAPALTATRRGLDAYEQARAALAKDKLEGIATYGRELAEALRAASAGIAASAPSEITDCLAQAAGAADKLASAQDLDGARREFGEVSRFVLALAASDPRLQPGWHRFDCPMAKGFGGWLQKSPGIENPYMGTAMSTCGSAGSFEPKPMTSEAGMSHEGHGHAGGDVAYYTCSMHPSVRQQEPGKCPICSMDLTGVTYDQQESGTIFVDESRRAVLGIKTSKVAKLPLKLGIRAVGRITYDETRLVDVTLKVKGWVAKLDVNATGQAVARGQRLLALYSPELFAAQNEYLLALRQSEGSGAPEHATTLAAASAKKLRLLGLTDAQLDEIKRRGTAIEELPIISPASGYVIAKDIVQGAAVEPGQRLYRIAALDQIWVEAAIYESDLPHVKKGQIARVALPYAKDRDVVGKVSTVYPYLDAASRTGKVRIELPNKDLALKPDMYADVAIDVELGPRLAVPVSAVVYTGTRRVVFLDLGGGQFRPQEVKLGARAGDLVEIASGLAEGQPVVTEGNFLIAAESRIRSTTFWEDEHGAK